MKFRVRLMKPSDRRVWAAMRARLWPEHPAEELDSEMDTLLAEGDFWTFIAEEADGTPAGFAEFSIRKFANGCTSRPVPFLEGIWIEPDYRRQGAGRALIEHAGTFFRERGFREL